MEGTLDEFGDELCAQCSSPQGKVGSLKKCSKCKLVAYCNYDCQLKHWKGGHKLVCVAISDAPKQGAPPIAAEVRYTLNQSLKLLTTNEENHCYGLLDKKIKKTMISPEEECANCATVGGRGDTVLSKCSKCLMVAYCSQVVNCSIGKTEVISSSVYVLLRGPLRLMFRRRKMKYLQKRLPSGA